MKPKLFLVSVTSLICLSILEEATAQIRIISGNNQNAATGTTLSPFVVSVTQPDGDLWVGATMKFTIIEGSGSLSYEEVNTNHEGEAQTTLTLPDVIGAVVVQVQVKDNPPGVVYARLNFTATAAYEHPIRIIKGNNQSAPTGTTLSPFVVSVTQPDGDPWVGVTMKFTIVEGSGSLSYEEVNINHEGEAQTTLTLPDVIGAVVVQVQFRDNPYYARNFTATAFAPPPSINFKDDSAARVIPENTPAGEKIGSPVAVEGNITNYYFFLYGGSQYFSVDVDEETGGAQLKTKAPLDFETRKIYTFEMQVVEEQIVLDHIDVTVNVLDVYAFTQESTTRSVEENVPIGTNIGAPAAAEELGWRNHRYELGATADIVSFSIDNDTGQLKTRTALDYETKNSYTVKVDLYVYKGGDVGWTKQDTITITVNVTDVEEHVNRAPVFTGGKNTTRSITEKIPSNQNIGIPVSATDADNDALTYTLGGIDALGFSIDSSTGQLKTKSPLDYETKNQYTVTVNVSDGSLTDTITVTIDVTEIDRDIKRAPVFSEGKNTTRSIAENTPSGVNIGIPVSATDPDGDTFTYSLGGTDAASVSIDNSTGQLQTKSPLDYETKNRYTVVVSAFDGYLSGIITVTINVTDVFEPSTNDPPVFTEGSRTSRAIAEDTPPNRNIGHAVSATDADNDPLIYTLGGTDAASFSIDSGTGQLKTKAPLDYQTKNRYTVRVFVSDGNGGSDNITVTITGDWLTNSRPSFTEGDNTTRAIAENTPPGVNIGVPVSATDPDGDILTYSWGSTKASTFFSIDTSTGQLKTKIPLDYEIKKRYPVVVSVTDGKFGNDMIAIIVNVTDVFENNPPVFREGDSTTRSIAEDTPPGVNIGIPVWATDVDDDTLTYSLSGENAEAFAIDSNSGQLAAEALLDYETKNRYTVVVSVSDGAGGSGSITVIVHVTDVSEPSTENWPRFTEGNSTTRSVAENTPSGQNVGAALGIAMPENPVKYDFSLFGPDVQSFRVGFSENGAVHLKTRAPLDYETKNQYTVKIQIVVAHEVKDEITVIIHVTDVDESADFDGDGKTDFFDFFLFADAFGGTDPRFDLDGSGTVDFSDFFLFADHLADPASGKLLVLAREMIGLQNVPGQLQQNVPNPFNSETVISWFLLRPGAAHVEVFALTGQRVAVLHQGPKKAGIHRVHWDGRDDRGRPLASGVYLYRLVTNEDIQTRKLTLLR